MHKSKLILCAFSSGLFVAFLLAGAILNGNLLKDEFSACRSLEKLSENVHRRFPVEFAGKTGWINGNGLYLRLLAKRTANKTLKCRGGLLEDMSHPARDITERALELLEWDAFVKSLGGRYLYVQAPSKLDRKLEMLPAGCNPELHRAWDGVDALLRRLHEAGVPYMDLSHGLADDFEQVSRNFYRTDHHWRYEAAFSKFPAVAKRIAELAGKSLPDDLPQFDSANWEPVTFKGDFLGVQGRRTGVGFAGRDDFTYFLPKFDTDIDFVFAARRRAVHRSGTFAESIIDSRLAAPDLDSWKGSRYHVYIGAGHWPISIRSRKAPCDIRLLVVKDSYALPMLGYLSTVFTQIEVIDPRGYKGSIAEYARMFRPDVMMTLVNVKALRDLNFYRCDAPFRPAERPVKGRKVVGTVEKLDSKSRYGNATAKCKPKPGGSYRLRFGRVALSGGGDLHAAEIALYDEVTKRRLSSFCARTAIQSGEWTFDVPADAQKPRLLFYAGRIGDCLGKSVRFEDVVLEELGESEK